MLLQLSIHTTTCLYAFVQVDPSKAIKQEWIAWIHSGRKKSYLTNMACIKMYLTTHTNLTNSAQKQGLSPLLAPQLSCWSNFDPQLQNRLMLAPQLSKPFIFNTWT